MKQSEVQTRLKELVLSYRDAESWPQLDVLYQLGQVVIADSFIASNIGIRYRIDGTASVQSVMQELQTRGIDPHRHSEAIDYWFSTRCGPDFERMVESRIRSLDASFKQLISELSLFKLSPYRLEGAFDPKWTVRACSWSIDRGETETEQKLIEIGIVNAYHYESTAFSHRAWDIPDYVQLLLNRIARSPEGYGCPKFDIPKIRGLAEEPEVEKFVVWLRQKGAETSYGLWIEEGQFEKELEQGGEQLRGIMAKLISLGAMFLSYSPPKRRVGKRDARPGECVFCFSPELVEALSG